MLCVEGCLAECRRTLGNRTAEEEILRDMMVESSGLLGVVECGASCAESANLLKRLYSSLALSKALVDVALERNTDI